MHVIVWSKQKKTIVSIIETSVSAVASYLAGDGGPHFERVVVWAADNQVAAELQARDHMIIVAF